MIHRNSTVLHRLNRFNRLNLLTLTVFIAATLVTTPKPIIAAGEPVAPAYDELSPAQEQAMQAEIQRNVAMLRRTGVLAEPDASQAVSYAFPLQMAPGLPDYGGFRVSAFVDHNPASGAILDYNGGTRTYDGHHGIDYALSPFAWNKLDAGAVQVVAAAAGTISAKANVDPTDRNCSASSSDPWNYVALTHADGRMTIYGHMRYNSLTSKGVGQTVAQGEYLGTAASSGNANGPHLHFEVRTASFSPVWIDPYGGPNSQPASLWADQRPYFDSAINRLATHSSPPSTPDVCQPTVTHLQDSFSTPSTVYFYAYYRDYQGGLVTQFNVYRPDGSVFQSWKDTPVDNTFVSAANRAAAFALSANDPAGTWRFAATYNGQTYETFFNVNAPPAINVVSPNGGEAWDRSSAHAVTWTDNLGGNVNIALYHNGVYSAPIVYNTPSDGEYLWLPGNALPAGPGYSIRVSGVNNSAVDDAGDADFTLSDVHLAAQDDVAITTMAMPIFINVLDNDVRVSGEPITITAMGSPMSGTVGLENARIVYTPALNFLGQDVFTYTVHTSAESADATVTVRVVPTVFSLFLPLSRR